MVTKLGISFFIFLFSATCMAGFRVGNGGNVIVCQNFTSSLDLYEGEVQSGFHYQVENVFWKDILASKLQALSTVQTPSKDVFLKWLADFDQDAIFVDAELGKISDSEHVVKPHNCEVVQAVNQQFDPLPGEKRYIVSKKLWLQLTDWDKAALVLHELAYRYLQHETSIQARAFTSLMFSREIQDLSSKELQQRIDAFGF